MVHENNFAVKIITTADHDKLKRGPYNYVALSNGAEYKIKLINNTSGFAVAHVKLEGENIGKWYIPAYDDIIIERPANVNRKFTFFAEDDRRAKISGVIAGDDNNGLIEVTFYPEKKMYKIAAFSNKSMSVAPSARSSMNFKSGSTVLGDRSTQRFLDANVNPNNIDWNDPTEIIIRLVVLNDYISIKQSKIPPRIDDMFY